MDGDTASTGESVALSTLSAEEQALVASTIRHFEDLSKQAGYDVDPLRMAFAGMGIAALIRQDITVDQGLKKIRSIREVAELMGVETTAIARKDMSDAGDIIDAINPRIEKLLDAIERGNDAAGNDEHSGARITPTTYQEMQG